MFSYNGYHLGEDWWGPRGRSSFGTPVHSIAHGMVTYAAPLGWGVDKGVVIVRHVFSDGSTILSFYGHLDPPSVVLNAGDCVARGDQVGRIGRPRGSPHLHFEIRTHTPTSPGRGYWSGDPTLAGWKPPSQYIWNHRIATSPGVQWTRPFVTWGTKGVGMLNGDTFAAIEDNRLIGVNVLDGSLRWSQSDSIKAANAMINVDRSVIYVVSQFVLIEAFRLPDLQDGNATATFESSLVSMWKIKLGAAGSATLMPLPDGGVMVSSGRKIFGVSPAGVLLWEHDSSARVFDWALADDRLIFATSGEDGSIWTADESGPMAWQTPITGRPVVVGDQILVYAEDGIYRLNSEALSAELLYALPRGYLERGDIVALSDGGVLVTHKDPFDQRLIALNADGALRWQRSYSNMMQGRQQRLLVLDSRAYLVSQRHNTSSSEVSIFVIDINSAALTRIFTSGSRIPMLKDTWAFAIGDDRILANIGGGSMVALDTRLAIEAVSQATNSQ